MDQSESTTLTCVLAQVPDPRKRRGRRHAWPLLWTLICTALLSEHRTPHAIAHWVQFHADE
jgi:DDE family transposase